MLSLFRTPTGNVIVGIIVVGIIVVFALEFRTGRGNPTASLQTECAVKFSGECVDQKDFLAAYGLIASRMDPKQSKAMSMRKKVLEGLAERELLATEAERLGLAVSDQQLDKELTAGRAHVSLPAEESEEYAFRLGLCRRSPGSYGCEPGTAIGVRQIQVSRTEGEAFDYKVYEKEIRIVANRGPREFRVAQGRELLAEQMRELVRQRVRIAENEAFSTYERQRSRAVIRSVVLERDWFAKFAMDTSDAAVAAWASANATQLDEALNMSRASFAAECPVVSEIMVPLPEGALDTEKAEPHRRIDALRERVTKGEAFDAVAREASAAPSAAFGGRVGCLNQTYGFGHELLLEAAKKLAPGAISDVVETARGLYVLRLDGKLEAATIDRDVRSQIARGMYLRFAAEQSMRSFATELVRQTKAGAKLEEVTRALSDELARRRFTAPASAKDALPPALLAPSRPRFEVSPPFTAAGNPIPDVEPSESLATRAFELEGVDTVDERPIDTRTGLVVMQLKEKTPASREEFDKDKPTLLRAMRQAKAGEAVARFVADLRKSAGKKLHVDERFAAETKASVDD